jgi:TctA family transporter
MLLSRGDPTVFVTRPISMVMLALAAGLLLIIIAPNIRRKRADVFVEET